MKIADARFVGSYPDHKLAPRGELPEIAFGGRSNVGKSSLINSLFTRKKLAEVSRTPGKTRLLNYFVALNDRGKETLFMVDLPGFGYARVSAEDRKSWKSMVEGYIENSSRLAGFILLVDSRRGLQDEEMQLIEYLISQGKKVCPILTKADKLSRAEGQKALKEITATLKSFGPDVNFPILHSFKNKVGADLIWHWILERIKDESR